MQCSTRRGHPYTQALLSAVPIPIRSANVRASDPAHRRSAEPDRTLRGLPVPIGCCFVYRALPEDRTEDCRTRDPVLMNPASDPVDHDSAHAAACFHIEARTVV